MPRDIHGVLPASKKPTISLPASSLTYDESSELLMVGMSDGRSGMSSVTT